jgi:hypothetical protein
MQLTIATALTFAASVMAHVPRQFFDNTPRLCQDPTLSFFENYRYECCRDSRATDCTVRK